MAINGTLMWIGEHRSREFTPPYQYCLDHAAQIALRHGFDDAISRAATDVRWVLYCETARIPNRIDQIGRCYSAAKQMTLLGPMCEGHGLGSGSNRYNCGTWRQVVPEFLGTVGLDVGQRCRSVAIVTQDTQVADSLLGLAESAGVTAFWCRVAGSGPIRNVDAVWWDDSIATPASASIWRKRLDSFGSPTHRVSHAWLANAPSFSAQAAATLAGVDVVVSKPFQIPSLLAMFDLRGRAARRQDTTSIPNAA